MNGLFFFFCKTNEKTRFMGLNDYGTQGILKRRLDKHMNYIKEDDKVKIDCIKHKS